MKDYAKVINQSKEIHGQQQVRQTLAHSAVQKTKEHKEIVPAKKGSGFFAVVVIFVVVAILFAVYRQYMHHRQTMQVGAQNTAAAETAPQQPTNPQFDFYTVLPNGGTPSATPDNSNTTPAAATAVGATASGTTATTDITTSSTTTAAPTATPNTTSTTATTTAAATPSPGQYYLDAGEFSNEADAQQTLSQLLLLGVQANIKSVQENGSPSYQVLVGPFDDQDTMSVVKQQLTAHQIQASVIQQ